MEKRRIRRKDISRMDGLLPPTRRVPVCNAITATEKKKEKKWSIGGLLRRISSIRDYDSSSNEEEIVYCKRELKTDSKSDRKSDGVVLHSVCCTEGNLVSTVDDNISQSADTLNIRRDSIHSRSSDGSLDGLGRKIRKSKLKARAEAKRDRLCPESSSDEDSRKSNNSLAKCQVDDSTQSTHKTSSCSRRTRAARTERYIKRLSKDESNTGGNGVNDTLNKRLAAECVGEHTSADVNGLCRPPVHPRRFGMQINNRIHSTQRLATGELKDFNVGLPDPELFNDPTDYNASQYITDLNQNNAYEKHISNLNSNKQYDYQRRNTYLSDGRNTNYTEYEHADHQLLNKASRPPEPPPRDPRHVFNYGYYSFPLNNKHRRTTKCDHKDRSRNETNETVSLNKGIKSYRSNDRITCYDETEKEQQQSLRNTSSTRFYVSREYPKNNVLSPYIENSLRQEMEDAKCQKRNHRNTLLNSTSNIYASRTAQNKLPKSYENNTPESTSSYFSTGSFDRTHPRSGSTLTSQEYSDVSNRTYIEDAKPWIQQDSLKRTPTEEILERRRSSKNLEEALSELEAIYNSLRLGDEDLLDRAERRSMEEFRLKRNKNQETLPLDVVDSPDRSKDDMAYRRMNPKERPTSLSDITGQSALSNISYLIASPILSRKDELDDLSTPKYPSRRGEPDVMRDDVVFRSISHANNTLKVIDPQPPFGIPLGPVTAATESDYLHTTPNKPDQPRSPYIPLCEPDIVTDDLAYRTLRKDANVKSTNESKTDVLREPELGTKKKRAVRSLSANLYGLINHDRIHLQRVSDLSTINDIGDVTTDVTFPTRPEYIRRVVSDGELSDQDTSWRINDSIKNNIDINGNHPLKGEYRKRLRVYVSPESIQKFEKPRIRRSDASVKATTGAALSSKTLDDEPWHDYLQSNSNASIDDSKSTETDFTAYSRLCQDLVNLIQGSDDTERKPVETEDVIPTQSAKVDHDEIKATNDESAVVNIQSLGSHYSSRKSTPQAEFPNDENIETSTDRMTNTEKEKIDDKTEQKDLDFYLRLADENVKIIADAFSSVADHLRDSCSIQKNTPATSYLETENDTTTYGTSTRSSAIYSQEETNEERSTLKPGESIVPDKNLSTVKGEPKKVYDKNNDNIDAELSKAVHDLQIAAASLHENEKEIETLEKKLEASTAKIFVNRSTAKNNETIENKSLPRVQRDSSSPLKSDHFERNQEEIVTESSTAIKVRADECDPVREGERTERAFDRKMIVSDFVLSAEMRVTYVTNLITITITTYSMVLLTCFVALLLAILAAL